MSKILKQKIRQIFIVLFVLSPLFLIFLYGIPLINSPTISGFTERCYKLDSLKSYLACTDTSTKKLVGFSYFEKIIGSINSLFYPFGYLFMTSFLLTIAAVILINLFNDKIAKDNFF